MIYDNTCFGIQHNGSKNYDPDKHPGREWEESQDWLIANNTIAYERNCSAIVEWGPHADDSRIENNIFYENRVNGTEGQSNGIHFVGIGGATGSTGMSFRNNLAYASGSGGKLFLTNSPNATEGANYTLSGNIVNTDSPEFVGAPAALPASPNFALAEESPAIDAGLVLSEVTTDYLGAPRPYGSSHDIGAYEYGAAVEELAPSPPMGLQVD